MKKKILIISIISILGLLALSSFFFATSSDCYDYSFCKNLSDSVIAQGLLIFCIFIIVFISPFSLLTFLMHDAVFYAWWNFAKWFIPIIIFALLIASSMGSGCFMLCTVGYIIILGPPLIIYIFVSFWKIIRAYREGKRTPIIDPKP